MKHKFSILTMPSTALLRTCACVALAAACVSAPLQAMAQTPAPAAVLEYRLGAGDVAHVTVYQSPDLTLDVRLDENGQISYPLLGAVHLGGMTVTQAEKRIADGLREGNFLKQPQVSILVTQVRGHQVSVLGQVGHPGRFALESADLHLTDVLALAGGVVPTGSDTVIVIGLREGKPFRAEIDLPTLFAANRSGGDILMQNGDAVWVDRAPMVFVYGEVQKPGALRLERGMTVMQALSEGGGLTQRGTERGLRVHRRTADGKTELIEVNVTDTLKTDDVLYVRESLF